MTFPRRSVLALALVSFTASAQEDWVNLFNGRNLDNWIGNKESYVAEEGMIVIKPEKGSGGNLFTSKEYSDFNFRFEFLLSPAANNGPWSGATLAIVMELCRLGTLFRVIEYARRVNPAIEVLLVSARSGTGIDAWLDWLLEAPDTRA